FATTAVIYAEISLGRDVLQRMHDELNVSAFRYDEPFQYHPHITLAQGLTPETVGERYQLAVRRWNESAPQRRVMIENLTFVQNTSVNRWMDLSDFELRAAALLI